MSSESASNFDPFRRPIVTPADRANAQCWEWVGCSRVGSILDADRASDPKLTGAVADRRQETRGVDSSGCSIRKLPQHGSERPSAAYFPSLDRRFIDAEEGGQSPTGKPQCPPSSGEARRPRLPGFDRRIAEEVDDRRDLAHVGLSPVPLPAGNRRDGAADQCGCVALEEAEGDPPAADVIAPGFGLAQKFGMLGFSGT